MTNRYQPVTRFENEEVKGHALCYEGYFRDHVERAQELRGQQAAYLDSLPSEPIAAINAARQILHKDADSYPEGIQEALHFSAALAELVMNGADRHVTWYLADRVAIAMNTATDQLDRIADILDKAARTKSMQPDEVQRSQIGVVDPMHEPYKA